MHQPPADRGAHDTRMVGLSWAPPHATVIRRLSPMRIDSVHGFV